MYLVDTDVVSEMRRGASAHPGVLRFFARAADQGQPAFISVVTLGEIKRGAEAIRHRGDLAQARRVEEFFVALLATYTDRVVDFGLPEALAWATMCVPSPHNPIDKQIAATAITRGWTVVTRNVVDFAGLGVRIFNPFDVSAPLNG